MLLKIFTFFAMTLLTLFILWAGGLFWFATNINFAKPEKPNMTTDAIIVLTGGTKRIAEGVDLLKKTKTADLFISGVNPDVQQKDLISDDSICCITLGYKATNTEENATEVKKWLSTKNVKNIRLVTSNYHMIRAMLEFQKIMPDLDIIPHPVTPAGYNIWDKKFWPITFSEYNKTLLIWLQLKQA
ncbi:MAG: hypothetical protein CMH31_04170 [Micavibrio sp.]|nr:hypothetical protein [Micavibrio sp.]